MRIVGGTLKGRTLAEPRHAGLRPTSDRVRESVFNILGHGIPDFTLAGGKVIDLFAGTGALGIEALSRGAAFCLFVDDDAEARGLVRQNIEALQLTGVSKVFRRDATHLGPAGRQGGVSLAFLDPPYGKGLAEKTLASLLEGAWLAPGALAVIEERSSTEFHLPERYEHLDQRVYGETQVVFARLRGNART